MSRAMVWYYSATFALIARIFCAVIASVVCEAISHAWKGLLCFVPRNRKLRSSPQRGPRNDSPLVAAGGHAMIMRALIVRILSRTQPNSAIWHELVGKSAELSICPQSTGGGLPLRQRGGMTLRRTSGSQRTRLPGRPRVARAAAGITRTSIQLPVSSSGSAPRGTLRG